MQYKISEQMTFISFNKTFFTKMTSFIHNTPKENLKQPFEDKMDTSEGNSNNYPAEVKPNRKRKNSDTNGKKIMIVINPTKVTIFPSKYEDEKCFVYITSNGMLSPSETVGKKWKQVASQISIRGSVHAATQAEIMNALLYKTLIEIQVTF